MGGLYSFQGGTASDTVFPDAKSAYKNILNEYTTVGVIGEGLLTDILSQSCLASHIIGLFKKGHFTPLPDLIFDTTYTQATGCFKDMKHQCDSVHVPVLFVLLPGKEYVSGKKAPVLDGVIPIDPHVLTLKDYTEGFDDHPNNSGHKKLADALDKIISQN